MFMLEVINPFSLPGLGWVGLICLYWFGSGDVATRDCSFCNKMFAHTMVVFCNKSEYCMHRSINILKSYKKGPHRFPSDNFSLWGDSAFSRSPRSSRFYHSAGGSKWRNVNTFSGSGLRGNSNGLLAECLLHRCPLLGPLLLLVFVTSRWKKSPLLSFWPLFADLPWRTCENDWNTPTCRSPYEHKVMMQWWQWETCKHYKV